MQDKITGDQLLHSAKLFLADCARFIYQDRASNTATVLEAVGVAVAFLTEAARDATKFFADGEDVNFISRLFGDRNAS